MADGYQPSSLEPGQVAFLRSIPDAVERGGMYGLGDVVRALMVALLTGGHVLLEGNPGLGKTALVRALCGALGLGRRSMGRIQFTPDLMPADITGTLMPAADGSGRLDFVRGPIFCKLLLADEINRATAKTQSAMLEAMAEYQVTVLGETHALRHWRDAGRSRFRTPFMVMATQNPIDQDGTYTLPEAQSDRFMFKIDMAMPGADVMQRIIAKALRPDDDRPADAAPQQSEDPVVPDAAMRRLHDLSDAVLSVPLADEVATHIANIVLASNGNLDEVAGVDRRGLDRLRDLSRRIVYPLGPRAGMALARAAVGWAAVALVDPDRAGAEATAHTPRALAETLVPVLRHRLRIAHDYAELATPRSEAAALDRFIRELAAAAAPTLRGRGAYADTFAPAIERAATAVRL